MLARKQKAKSARVIVVVVVVVVVVLAPIEQHKHALARQFNALIFLTRRRSLGACRRHARAY